MSRPAPSPPRFATARDDGAHCGAGPLCTFKYARTLPPTRETANSQANKKYLLEDTKVFNDHTTSTTHGRPPLARPPRVSNHRPPPLGPRALRISYADEVRYPSATVQASFSPREGQHKAPPAGLEPPPPPGKGSTLMTPLR